MNPVSSSHPTSRAAGPSSQPEGRVNLTLILREAGVELPPGASFDVTRGSDAERELRAFAQLYRAGGAGALDCVWLQGLHQDAFKGAARLLAHRLLPAKAGDPSYSGGSWVNFLAAHGSEAPLADEDARLCGEMKPISLAERFQVLRSLGVALDAGQAGQHSPLRAALQTRNLDTFRALVEAGADPHETSSTGIGLMHVAAGRGALPIMRELRRLGLPVEVPDHYGATPLHTAAACGEAEAIAWLLGERDVKVNALNHDGQTPLQLAVQYDLPDAVKALVDDPRVSLSARNAMGETVLHVAADLGYPEVLEVLLSSPRVEVDLVDGNSATPLHAAAQSGQVATMVLLIKDGRLDVNAASHGGFTALHLACQGESVEAVRVLLAVPGIKVNARTLDNSSALHFAAWAGTAEIVDALLASRRLASRVTKALADGRIPEGEAGAPVRNTLTRFSNEKIEIDARAGLAPRGPTPLHYAVQAGRAAVAEKLVAAGADASLENAAGLSAAALAEVIFNYTESAFTQASEVHALLRRRDRS